MKCLGVDWASGGWVVAVYDDADGEAERESVRVEAQAPFLNIVDTHQKSDSILVDVPIGLESERGYRAPDTAAREMLEDRRSTVFGVPCEAAVEAETYDEGREENGGRLGSHSWSLVHGIKEVRAVLRLVDDLPRIYESHPEICFHCLDERPMSEPKSSKAGKEERRKAFQGTSTGGQYTSCYDEVENRAEDGTAWQHRIGLSRLDDVLDALAMARTAELAERGGGLDFLPETSHMDFDVLEEPAIAYYER
jgi:predicted RNase H-like nuclease